MKKISLLGISADTISVIFDLLIEDGYSVFDLHSNIENSVLPFLPINEIKYSIKKKTDSIKGDVFFGLASPKNKFSVFNSFLDSHKIDTKKYIKIIHNTAYISKSSIIENGVLIEPNVTISSQSKIGFGVFVKRGSQIGHHNTIGDYTDINPGVVISGKVTIGNCCIIGTGTIIKDNIIIGENTIIGVGSVVTKDIPSNSVAYGNPCVVVKLNI